MGVGQLAGELEADGDTDKHAKARLLVDGGTDGGEALVGIGLVARTTQQLLVRPARTSRLPRVPRRARRQGSAPRA